MKLDKTKIAMFSFADINNYGDILFSHVVKYAIEKRIDNVVIDFYCPTSITIEGFEYKGYDRDLIEKEKYDILLLAGGEVVHLYDDRTWKPIYLKNKQDILSENPSDVVFDWADMSDVYKVWMSVGVRPFEDAEQLFRVQNLLKKLDYISVRGVLSKKILEGGQWQFNDTSIGVTPDLGWLFPSLLDYYDIRGKEVLNYVDLKKEYLVFQINNITREEAALIAEKLLQFKKKYKVEIVLLPVIEPWEDYKYLAMIDEFSTGEFVLLPEKLKIFEICDIIVHAKYVLCSSLHTAITALAEGVPAAIINKWQGTKLQDLWGHQFRLNALDHDFNNIDSLLENLVLENKEQLLNYAKFMRASLGCTFDQIVNKIKNNG